MGQGQLTNHCHSRWVKGVKDNDGEGEDDDNYDDVDDIGNNESKYNDVHHHENNNDDDDDVADDNDNFHYFPIKEYCLLNQG